jgi:Holliday junction resolvase
MTNGRNKGAAFEREIASLIRENLGIEVKRDLEQYRAADHGDLLGLPFTIECKRYAMAKGGVHHPDWWEQVVKAHEANPASLAPVLIYKYDRAAIRVVVPLSFINKEYEGRSETATLTPDCWFMLVREILADQALQSGV